MAVAVGQKGIADNHLRHRPSHGSLVCSMLTKEAAVPVVRRVSPLATKCALNGNSRNVFLTAVKKVVAQAHRAIEHPLNRIRNKLALRQQATMQSRCNRLVKGPLVIHAAPLDQNANTVANHPRFRKLALGCVVGIFKTDAFQPTRALFGRRSLKIVLEVIEVSPFEPVAFCRPQPITIRK